jgi:hypothetical protein
VNPPGDNDADAADNSQVPLALVAPLAAAVIIGGSIAFYFVRRSRSNGSGSSEAR